VLQYSSDLEILNQEYNETVFRDNKIWWIKIK
jgi:hypothetical protein